MPESETNDRTAIDRLVSQFFAGFTNEGGAVPQTESLAALFIPSAVICKTVGDVETYSVQTFIEPRARLLSDGSLREFREWETESRTDIAGNVAQRISLYGKSGIMMGEPFEGKGVKVFQFVRTTAGWRIAALAWDDEREGFHIPGRL